MFRRVRDLIASLLATMNLDLDSATIREAILKVLTGLQVSAAATPGVFDDILIALAISLVKSPAWDAIFASAQRQSGKPQGAMAEATDADLEAEILAAFDAIAV